MELGEIYCQTCQVPYYIKNLMECGYQSLDPGSKVQCLLKRIWYDKLSTTIGIVRAHPDKYEKDFNAVVI